MSGAGAAACAPAFLLAVHAGAGWHAPGKEAAYRQALSAALQAGGRVLQVGGCALEACTAAIASLEDAACTNAGRGCNLGLEGDAEADACAMAGCGLLGAVAAAPGIDNPIKAAAALAAESCQPLPCGLVRPVCLAGDAARRFALRQGLPAAPTAAEAGQRLATPAAKEAWQRYRAMLDAAGQQPERARRAAAAPAAVAKRARLADVADTVGAVCVRLDSRRGALEAAAGVSSGGLALKQPGRVGEAGVPGAGCWAADGSPAGPAVAVSCSGVGERIMAAGLARAAAAGLQQAGEEPMPHAMEVLLASSLLSQPGPHDAGVLALRAQPGAARARVELAAAFTAPSFAVGWLQQGAAPVARVLRQEQGGGGSAGGTPHISCLEFAAAWPVS